MYYEWVSLSPIIAENICGALSNSVLNKFSGSTGKEVAILVVKQLASNLGIAQTPRTSILETDDEVLWCMDVICYGLSLPLSEHETIKDCVNVYCEWLTALNPVPRVNVPEPICNDPNTYSRRIINHFHNLFVQNESEGLDMINKHAVRCHQVLRTLQDVAQSSQILTSETWETLLLFLLSINEILLAPPAVKEDVGDHLCERVLSVLFEIWLLACVRCFPSPSLWKTLQKSCSLLRHRIALIEQWSRVNLALTARMMEFMYGPTLPELKLLDEYTHIIPHSMTDACAAQTWYRFLHTIGSPTDLCSPQIISRTPKFMQWASDHRHENVETYQHPCLLLLPQIFLKAIRGIASQVDTILALPFVEDNRPSMIASRPKCNSILHLFGEWLFEGAHIGGEAWLQTTKKEADEASRRPSSIIMDNRKGSLSLSQPTSLAESNDIPVNLAIDKYESGLAEAVGVLCRIFCAKKTGEEILPSYLARFYTAVKNGLKLTENRECKESMASILYNSGNLFRVDLDGLQVLLPSFITAIDLVLSEKEIKIKNSINIDKTDLRRSAIQILISILALPLHFQSLPIRELNSGGMDKCTTFIQLKPILVNILMSSLQVESDSQNTHMILGGLLLCIQDVVMFEVMNNPSDLLQGYSPPPTDVTMLSSACSEKSFYSFNNDELFGFTGQKREMINTASGESTTEGHSTTVFGIEMRSLTVSDITPVDLLHDVKFAPLYADNAHALFVRATYLVCHRLISSWKTDLNVSLAALELLSGLARMEINVMPWKLLDLDQLKFKPIISI